MREIKQQENETREHYLLRVAAAFVKEHAQEQTMIWDDAECDGYCLVEDIESIL